MARTKQHTAHEIHKIADQALEAKSAQVTNGSQNLDWRRKRIKRERNEQRIDTNAQIDQHMLYPFVLVVQKVTSFVQTAEGPISQIMLPTWTGSTFFKQVWKTMIVGEKWT